MGKNKPNDPVEINQTDLITLLGCLASDLRNAGQAIRAMGTEQAGAGARDLADADRMAGSLDRISEILDAVRDRLCQSCQLMAISERIQVEILPRRGAK